MLDLRNPSGSFFLLLGAILIFLGISYPSLKAPLSPVNVNLYAGAVMATFGGLLLWLAHRRS